MAEIQTKSSTSHPEVGLATVREAEDFLRVSRTMVYNLMDDGTLPYIKLGRARRISWKSLYKLAEVGTVEA